MDSGVFRFWNECWVEDTIKVKVLVIVCGINVEIQIAAGEGGDGGGRAADKKVGNDVCIFF